jgi:hypothetical protein
MAWYVHALCAACDDDADTSLSTDTFRAYFMSRLRRWERRLEPFAISNLTQFLIAGQAVVFLAIWLRPGLAEQLTLQPARLWAGEWWRALSFVFVPALGLIFWILAMMVLHLAGTALESMWGTLRYNLFVLTGILFTVAAAAVIGAVAPMDEAVSNAWLYSSIFLAFAYLNPEFELLMMLVIPVKIKWLGLLTLAASAYAFLTGLATFRQGGWVLCLVVLAGNLNLLLFLGPDLFRRVRRGNLRALQRHEQAQRASTPRHVCTVCGATERSHPDREFRYCPQCAGTPAYCNEHLAGHEHRPAPPEVSR